MLLNSATQKSGTRIYSLAKVEGIILKENSSKAGNLVVNTLDLVPAKDLEVRIGLRNRILHFVDILNFFR